MVRHRRRRRRRITPKFLIILILFIAALLMGILAISALVENGKTPADEPQGTGKPGLFDTLFGGSLPEAVRALASESGASQSQLERAIRVLEEQHQEAEEYDLYDPYG